MSDHPNIFIRSTAGETPWSNGMISKLMVNKSNYYPMKVILDGQLVRKLLWIQSKTISLRPKSKYPL